jgi:hypothetical protein
VVVLVDRSLLYETAAPLLKDAFMMAGADIVRAVRELTPE